MPIVSHPFPPFVPPNARVLILGTMPSEASRSVGFYYGHARNRFWPVLASLFETPVPQDRAKKCALLSLGGLALWDVLSGCDIVASADASIRAPAANDLTPILADYPHLRLYANGQIAARLYRALCQPQTGRPIVPLPSTSPANAAWSLGMLQKEWSAIREND